MNIKVSLGPNDGRFDNHVFRMTLDDVFQVTGRGVVAVGTVAAGIVSVGDEIDIRHNGRTVARPTVDGVESFGKRTDVAGTGDKVGLLLSDVTRDQLSRGMVAMSQDALSASFDGQAAKPVTVDGVPVSTTFPGAGAADGSMPPQFSTFQANETVDRLSDAAANAAHHKDFTKGEEFRGLGFTDDSTPGHVGSSSKAFKGSLIAVLVVLAALALSAKMLGLF